MEALDKVWELIDVNKIQLIFLTEFGSHLYGTSTSESDRDYKGVFLPTKEQCYLNSIPRSLNYNSKKDNDQKNTKDDVDIELYSLQYYLKLLQTGDTGAIDILHARSNESAIIHDSIWWDFIYQNRKDFYTTNLRAFVGYCRTQAAKYGIKGSRLNAAKDFLDLLDGWERFVTLENLWGLIKEGEHINKIDADPENGIQFPMVQVCGKKIQSTVTVAYARSIIERFYEAYGARAQLAANNEGIDWKALSHAVRCALEMRSIYRDGDIVFPLKEADVLLSIKNGEKDYLTFVSPMIEDLMEEVEELAENSTLPKKPNMKKFEKWLISLYQ